MLNLKPDIYSYSIYYPDNRIRLCFRNAFERIKFANGASANEWSVLLCENTNPAEFFHYSGFEEIDANIYGMDNYGWGFLSENNPHDLSDRESSQVSILIKVSADILSNIREALLSEVRPNLSFSIHSGPAFQPSDSTPMPDYIWDTSKEFPLVELVSISFSKVIEKNDRTDLVAEKVYDLSMKKIEQKLKASFNTQKGILVVVTLLLIFNVLVWML